MEDLEADITRLLEAGDLPAAASVIMRGYGPAILGYLFGLTRDEDRADDVFLQFCEDLWRGLPGFRRDSSSRTWVYTVAWHAWLRQERDAYRRHGRPLASEEMSRLAAEVRSTTALHLKSEVKDAVARLREQLSPAEQSLLVLRVDRELSWGEVAAVMSSPEDPLESADSEEALPAGEGQAPDARRGRRTPRAAVVLRGILPGANRSLKVPVARMNTAVCSLRQQVPSEQTSPGANPLVRSLLRSACRSHDRPPRRRPVVVAGVDASHRRRPVSPEQQRRNCT